MSTSASVPKHTFLVYAPDKKDADALQRRLSVREQHLANAKTLVEQGIMKMGGAMVTEETLESPQKHMIGSTLLYRADSSAEVRKIVEADIYYKAGVWDPEQLVIVPFVEPPAHK